jgi:hypothetical protein
MSLPADEEDDEDWLREHQREFPRGLPSTDALPAPEPRRQVIHPIVVSDVKKLCSSCGFDASVELFRDEKCLACQAADFLGPLK